MRFAYLLKLATAGIVFGLTSSLNAWEISILDPQSSSSGNNVQGRNSFSTFFSYLQANATVTTNLLETYTINNSDAVIVNLTSSSTGYTDTEISVLTSLLNSNTRVLVFAESNSWQSPNIQLANLLGVSYSYASGNASQTVISTEFPEITNGVNDITFNAVGKMYPTPGNGHTLTDDYGITLWGDNDNFLLFMDVDAMSGSILSKDNNQLAQNIANWLAGSGINIPEPSSYTLILGVATLGLITVRRKKHN